jgi:hypothetical protein
MDALLGSANRRKVETVDLGLIASTSVCSII